MCHFCKSSLSIQNSIQKCLSALKGFSKLKRDFQYTHYEIRTWTQNMVLNLNYEPNFFRHVVASETINAFLHSEIFFLTFPACFLIPIFFSNLKSNLLDMRNFPEQVEKLFCYQKLFLWSQTFYNFSAFILELQKFFSITRTFLTVGQNYFGTKIPFPSDPDMGKKLGIVPNT